MEKLFKEYDAIAAALHHDLYPIILRVVGHLLIGITFTTFGIICIMFAGKYTEKVEHRKRTILTYLVASAYLACGLTRFFGVVITYHNYAVIDGWLSIMTGVMGMVTLGYLPYVIRAMKRAATMADVKEKLEETNNRMKELKDITDKLTER